MPEIKLLDGKKIPFSKKIDGFEIANKISKSLAKEACVMTVSYTHLTLPTILLV